MDCQYRCVQWNHYFSYWTAQLSAARLYEQCEYRDEYTTDFVVGEKEYTKNATAKYCVYESYISGCVCTHMY